MFAYLNGRSGRKEYWIGVGLLILVSFGLAYANAGAAGVAMTFLWVLIWNRRLHDIGRPGWVILILFGLMLAILAAGFVFGGKDVVEAIQFVDKGSGPVNERGLWIFDALGLLLLVIQFGFTIWLGVKKGDPGDNRFGPPPPAI